MKLTHHWLSSSSYSGHDEFSGEEADGRESAVGEEGDGSEGVDSGVDIGKTFKPLEVAPFVPIPNRAVPAKEDLHRAKSPTQDLVETVR